MDADKEKSPEPPLDALEFAYERIDQLEADLEAKRWIDIKERQPKDGQVVLIAIRTNYTDGTTRFDVTIGRYKWGEFGSYRYPSHWMSLPDTPAA